MSRLAISNIAWDAKADEAMYALLKRAGYTGLEIAPTRLFPERPYECCGQMEREARRLKEEYGLAVVSMQSIWYGRTERLFGSGQERDILLGYTRQAIDFAASAGCKNLVFGSPKNRIRQGGAREEEVEAFFREAGEYASERGTCLAMEANPKIYGTDYINRTEEAFELAKRVGSAGFRVNLELGTVIENGERIEDLEKEMNWVNHIHISEPHLAAIAHRSLHKELADMLRQVAYPGYVSIEMGRQEPAKQAPTRREPVKQTPPQQEPSKQSSTRQEPGGAVEEAIWYVKEIFG